MSFTSEVVLYCLVLPGLVAGGVGCLSVVLSRRASNGDGDVAEAAKSGSIAARGGCTAAVGWCFAMLVALGLRQWEGSEQSLSATTLGVEAWQQVLWPMFAFAFVLSVHRIPVLAREGVHGEARYVAAAVAACAIAFVVLPRGEGWTDLLPLHRPWFALTVSSCLLNAWTMERMVRSGARHWVLLVLLAGLGPPAMLGAVTYAAPAEWTFAAIAATSACLFVAWGAATRDVSVAVWAIIYPGSVVIASMTTTARFYTYEDYPHWIYAIALFLPSWVGWVDRLVDTKSWLWRVPIAACVSASMIAACVWQLVLSQPADNW